MNDDLQGLLGVAALILAAGIAVALISWVRGSHPDPKPAAAEVQK